MNDLQVRLSRCFSAVFPALCPDTILEAQSSNVENWDSVASVTLFATIEEEFGIEIDVQDLKDLLSYKKLVVYLQQKLEPDGSQK
jgi:acyl carrier protein